VVGIGAISLLVGSIGILTMMWISVNERTSEIGLVRAIGATSGQVLLLFLTEAALISTLGGILGVTAGLGVAQLRTFTSPPSRCTRRWCMWRSPDREPRRGLASGLMPARRAAALDPVVALTEE